MAKRKDTAAAAAKIEPTPAIETPKLEAPKAELPQVESPSIDPLKAETTEQTASETPPEPEIETPTKPDFAVLVATPGIKSSAKPSWSRARTRRFALLAASVAIAAAIGGIVGAAATASFSHPKPVIDTAAAEQNRALKTNVARLTGELATVKAGIDNASRSAATQLNKLADRLDRAEKAQAEPASKLAKIMESLDRLERHPQVAAATPDVTGSVSTIEKQQGKPPMIEGWRLRDFYAGHAVLQNRSGTLYEVAVGANLPGVGKVESVKREDGRVVITTAKGIIAGNFEPRRSPYYLPPSYRY